ncbi:MAG TPA: hypothetical protein VFA96_00515, partial [Nocardioides sp.]|nr:hypothetical protein [Nocardioides sp.]
MHGRRLALALLLAASSALTAGCRSAAGPTTPKTVADITSASSMAAVQTLLDHRAIALLGHDRSAFDAT